MVVYKKVCDICGKTVVSKEVWYSHSIFKFKKLQHDLTGLESFKTYKSHICQDCIKKLQNMIGDSK